MKTLSCAAARRRLQAFHDEELSIADQIAMTAHIERCDACAESLADLQFVSTVVKSTARERLDWSDELAFQQAVISRMAAEEHASWQARLRDMFDDMRLVYAGMGGVVAALACVLMMLNVMRSVREDRNPDSLAGIVKTMVIAENRSTISATDRGAAAVEIVMDARLLPPSSSGATYAADSDAEVVVNVVDAEFAFRGVITREGRVDALELVHLSTGLPVASGTDEARALRKLMGAVARGRYKPASVNGLPVAVNKVWLVAHTTVHGDKESAETPPLSSRKRITSVSGSRSVLPA